MVLKSLGIYSPSYAKIKTYMETTFKVISNLSNIRYIDIFIVLVIITREIKINLLTEEVFQEKVHEFTILFLFKVVIIEHGY